MAELVELGLHLSLLAIDGRHAKECSFPRAAVEARARVCAVDALIFWKLQRSEGAPPLVGDSIALGTVRRLVARVAASDATVLVRGETGTGKELVARAIHEGSRRAAGPLVAVNCGALPEHLVESELFGHRRGAFTGADEHRAGLFEVADGGTLFLDEIGELPRSLQSRLLRVLESGEIRRVGVAVPPLRERRDDIPSLVRHFVRRARPQVPSEADVAEPAVLAALTAHHWPGNVRELANVIEHALVLSDHLPLTLADLPARLGSAARTPPASVRQETAARVPPPSSGPTATPEASAHDVGSSETTAAVAATLNGGGRPGPACTDTAIRTLRELELEAIRQGLERNGGNKPRTAEELGISLKTLYNKLHQMESQDRATA